MLKFEPATRRKKKLRLCVTGTSGSGKTYSALLIAKGMVGTEGKIAVLDTENESAALYAGAVGMPAYDTLCLPPPYTPERYIEAIQIAEQAGYNVLIIDSATHEWNGIGGILELVGVVKKKYSNNDMAAWNELTPRHRKFLDAIVQSKLHVIVTLRSKTEYALEQGANGKTKPVKLGMKAETREGFEYECDIVLDIGAETHHALASKSRAEIFGIDPFVITEETGEKIMRWLEDGEEAPEPKQPPKPQKHLSDAQMGDLESKIFSAKTPEEVAEKQAKIETMAIAEEQQIYLIVQCKRRIAQLKGEA